jgi:hypothetical protein
MGLRRAPGIEQVCTDYRRLPAIPQTNCKPFGAGCVNPTQGEVQAHSLTHNRSSNAVVLI